MIFPVCDILSLIQLIFHCLSQLKKRQTAQTDNHPSPWSSHWAVPLLLCSPRHHVKHFKSWNCSFVSGERKRQKCSCCSTTNSTQSSAYTWKSNLSGSRKWRSEKHLTFALVGKNWLAHSGGENRYANVKQTQICLF